VQSVEIRRAINAQDVAEQASAEIVTSLTSLLEKQEQVHLALTGGTVGIKTLGALAQDTELGKLDLNRIHIWWGDERYVEQNSPDRNANQAREALLAHVDFPKENIHEFPATDSRLSVVESAEVFQKHIEEVFAGEQPKMDLTILGMGPDGHIASLFPGYTYPSTDIVSIDSSPKPPSERISFSFEMLNRSTKIIFVVSGIDKAEAVEKIHTETECVLPAANVSALNETIWFIDEAAGAAFWNC
jgi:6-phosphogluconolactonase